MIMVDRRKINDTGIYAESDRNKVKEPAYIFL